MFWFDGDEDAEIAAGWYAVYQYTLEVRENPHTASGNVFCVKKWAYNPDYTSAYDFYIQAYEADVVSLTLDQSYYVKIRHTDEATDKLRFEFYGDSARTSLIDEIVVSLAGDFSLAAGQGIYVWSITAKAPEKASSGWLANLDYGLPPALEIRPAATESTSTMPDPALGMGAASITPAGTESTSSVGGPSVAPGPVTIEPESTESTESIGGPLVQIDSQVIYAEGVDTTAVIPAPAVTPGQVTITPESVESTSIVGSPTVAREGDESSALPPGAKIVHATQAAAKYIREERIAKVVR